MGELIPLFPLGTPLFPGVVLPLQIFEPRYRRLVHDLLALPEGSDRRFFGVVAIRQGWEVEAVAPAEALYDVGCTARVQAGRPQPDGGFRVVTVGGDRFRLLDVVVGDGPALPAGPRSSGWPRRRRPRRPRGTRRPRRARRRAARPAGRATSSAAVARGSMVLARGVRDLFTRYVAEVAELGRGGDEARR